MFYGSPKISYLVWGVILGGLVSCTQAITPPTPPSTATPTPLGQTLPITAKVTIAGQEIDLEVARTPEQQNLGLMFRRELAANRGMLFPFEPPRPVSFWMKNTLIPLDMIFLRDRVVQAVIANVPPCVADPCPSYGPSVAIDQVIEIPGGRASQLGIREGDRLEITYLR